MNSNSYLAMGGTETPGISVPGAPLSLGLIQDEAWFSLLHSAQSNSLGQEERRCISTGIRDFARSKTFPELAKGSFSPEVPET